MLYVFLSVAAISLAAWDAWRRWMNHDRALMGELPKLIESSRTQKAALEEFLRQMASLVGYTAEKKRELEMRLAGKKLP